jgi:polysaccharide biosynthesis protein PslH
MKILAVYPYVPWPLNRGAYHRAFHLLKGLAAHHSVDLLLLAENGEGQEHATIFQDFCDSVRVAPFHHPAWQRLVPNRLLNPLPATVAHWTEPRVAGVLRERIRHENYDAVHILDLVLAQYFQREHRELPLVLDRTRVDLQYQLMEQKRMQFSLKNRLLNYENLAKLWAFEKAIARRCAAQVVCGSDDAQFVRKHISKRVPIAVIPNGVDLAYFHPSSVPEARASLPTVIFCGAMDYNPNVDALRWFFGDMHRALLQRIPNLQVLVVGKDPLPEVRQYGSRPGVIVTGGVPDVRPYYKRAWLQIVPLRIGGGTRLKIVESLAIGTPVVSTRIGAQGLDLVHEHDILYGDTATEFVEESARALKDMMLRTDIERYGRESVEQRLSWTKLARDLSQVYSARFERFGSLELEQKGATIFVS